VLVRNEREHEEFGQGLEVDRAGKQTTFHCVCLASNVLVAIVRNVLATP